MTGAPAFHFSPENGRIECNAYSAPFKALAVVVVTLAFAWAWRMWSNGIIELTLKSSGWLAAALIMMAYTEWHIIRGKTTLDNTSLKQSWVWNKSAALNELAYAKLIRIRGLDWLIAPRLYTKTYSGKLAIFYAADGRMLAEFQRLEQALRGMRDGSLK